MEDDVKEAAQPYDSDARSVMNEQTKKKTGMRGVGSNWKMGNQQLRYVQVLQFTTSNSLSR